MIILGQCTLTMRNKIESNGDYKQWEENDDVGVLLMSIKDLSNTTTETQYEYWTLAMSMKSITMMRQYKHENLTAYYKCFMNSVEVSESQWGALVPTKMGGSTDKT